MPFHSLARAAARWFRPLRRPRWRLANLSSLGRRVAHFWLVWPVLLLVHEAGHAIVGSDQGQVVQRITIGAGPALLRERVNGTEIVLRLVPIAGYTSLALPTDSTGDRNGVRARLSHGHQLATLSGGVVATLVLATLIATLIAVRERITHSRWVWPRILLADALVLSVFNLLPVPPLDGGRAVLTALSALRDAPLSANAVFWVQVGGLALAVVPMTLWTSWTRWLDGAALWWGAPVSDR